jgi:hypothetical protein
MDDLAESSSVSSTHMHVLSSVAAGGTNIGNDVIQPARGFPRADSGNLIRPCQAMLLFVL